MGEKKIRNKREPTEESKVRKQIVAEVIEIIGCGAYLPNQCAAILFKNIKEIDKLFEYEQILLFLQDNKTSLIRNMSKIEPNNVIGKIFYISKAIKNHINGIGEY